MAHSNAADHAMRPILIASAAARWTGTFLQSLARLSGKRRLNDRMIGVATAQISQAAAVVKKREAQLSRLPRAAIPTTTWVAVITPTASQTMAIHQEWRVRACRR